MFYVTQIKSVGEGGVIDVQGRRLNFIGYLPVKAGDSVYTDGKVIFGNAPPKGAPAIFEEPSGVPVLADEDSSGNAELRGYFTNRGKYKNYRIAGDDWITNSKKKYSHDDGEDETIIDAEITEDGDEIVVKKGIYQDSRTLETTYVIGCINDAYLFRDKIDSSLCISLVGYGVMKEKLGSELFPNTQTPAQILKNGKTDKEIDLEFFAKDVEQRALLCADEIMKNSYSVEDVQSNDLTPLSQVQERYGVSYMTLPQVTDDSRRFSDYILVPGSYLGWLGVNLVNYYNDRQINEPAYLPPSAPFIAYSSAHILTSNFDNDDFSGVVFASAYGYCFPYIRPRFTLIDSVLATPDPVGHPVYNKIYEWKCVPFGMSCFYKVGKDNSNLEPVAFRDFGGANSTVTISETVNFQYPVSRNTNISFTSAFSTRQLELMTNFETQDISDVFLPVGEGFYKMDKFGRLTFYDSKKNLVDENIPVHDDFYHIEIEDGYFLQDRYLQHFNDKPRLKCKVYTSDGEIEEARIRLRDTDTLGTVKGNGNWVEGAEVTVPPMDGYYIKQDDGTLDPLNFTPLFYQFKNGDCLYGVRGGKLYLKTKDGIEIVGDGVKNFRLRELKKISKAKK